MEFRVLGPLELVGDDGRPVSLPSGKPRVLLAMLLLDAGRVVSVDRIVGGLWGDNPPATAEKVVQGYVSRLRKLLPRGVLETREPGYLIHLLDDQLDVRRFERLRRDAAAAGAEGRWEAGAELLAAALSLWRGRPLADVGDALRVPGEVTRLDELRLVTLEERIDADLALGLEAQLVAELEALTIEHPLRERMRGQLMLALYRVGRQADALLVYQETRKMLVDELGLKPSESLQQLERAILQHDASIELAETRRAAVPGPPDAPVPSPARKTVTVLVCDVIDVSVSGEGLDPESRRLIMSRYLEAVTAVVRRYGGTIERFIGDAVMAVFGVPVLREDDALRAVRAAAELRVGLVALNRGLERDFGTRLELQIGVDTGEVVTGSGEAVTGDVVNRAGRLQRAAAPNEILLGLDTLTLTRRAVTVGEVVEEVELSALDARKGTAAAFRLVEVQPDAPAVRRLDVPIVGRVGELRHLEDLLVTAAEERACVLCTLLGPAGIGKSRLARAFLAGVEVRVVSGRCLSYGEGITYWPVVEVVQQLSGERERLIAEVPEATAPLNALLGGSESSTSEEIAWAVRKLVEASAASQPLVIVFDDVQWGEATFLDLVEHVAYLSRDAPILLLCLARPELLERRPGWASGSVNAATVVLEPLDAVESDELIGRLLGDDELERTLVARIRAAAEGNPLFLEEMLAMVLDSGKREVSVPPTIKALLAARLDQLDPAERAVLGAGAVEGQIFHRGAVAAMATQQASVERQLVTLVRKEFVRPDRPQLPGEDAYRFRHLLIREAAYDALPKVARAELHERCAAWLEQRKDNLVEFDEILGYHLEQSYRYHLELGPADATSDALAARAAEHLTAAGLRARNRDDRMGAVALLTRAADLHPSRRLALLPLIGDVLRQTGDYSRSAALLDEAIESARVQREEAVETVAALLRTIVAFQTGEVPFAQMAAEADRAVTVLERVGDDAQLALALEIAAGQTWGLGRVAEATILAERALWHARRAGDDHRARRCVRTICVTLLVGPAPVGEALEYLNRLSPELGAVLAPDNPPAVTAAVIGAYSGRFAEARQALTERQLRARELGDYLRTHAHFSQWIGRVELLSGNPAQAELVLREGYDRLGEIGEQNWRATNATLLADALMRQGRDEDALEVLAVADEIAQRDDYDAQVRMRAVCARILARRGELAQAEQRAREAVEMVARTDDIVLHGDALLALAEALRASGATNAATAALRQALELFERKENVVQAEEARALLADVEVSV